MPRESKTIAKSFRVDKDALEMLREEAKHEAMSLNTLVSQVLLNYARTGRFAKRMHAVTVGRNMLSEFVDPLSDDEITKAAQNTGRASQVWMVAVDGKITVGNVINFVHDLSSSFDWFEYTEKNEGEHWTITLMHEMGHKWSLFVAEFIKAAFAAANCPTVKFTIADQYVTFTI